MFRLLLATVLVFSVCPVYGKLPEEDLDIIGLIKYWGYPSEEHKVLTDDGYYLTVQRIPYGRKQYAGKTISKDRPVFLLIHGLLCSGSNWVTNLPGESLAFMLADAGYDVWIGNARGNTYSLKHEKYSVDSDEFWNFSFEELAKYDLPAMVDYSLNVTRQKQLYYVGHSQGTMMAFAGLSENKELNQKIKQVFALAPVARLTHASSPITYLSYLENEIGLFFDLIGARRFLPSNNWIKMIADQFCGYESNVCDNILFLIAGADESNMNVTRTPVYLTHTPAGTSVKNMLHFAQLVEEKHFQRYDYGYVGNLRRYGSLSPSSFDLSKIKTPIALYSGGSDTLAAPKDVAWLKKHLKKVVRHKVIPEYNHLDFIWGMTANTKVYKDIIRLARKMEHKIAQ